MRTEVSFGSLGDIRIFTIADAEFFPGLVALVNSLRLQRHDDPITVLDLGLTAAQRAEIADECDLVSPRADLPPNPWLLAPYVCRTREATVAVYIDADVIITASLEPIFGLARAGSVCAFPDNYPRFFPEWEEVFELRAPLRHQRYVNAGFVAFSPERHPTLLPRWEQCCARIRDRAGTADGTGYETPTGLPDQDALNALLMSEFAADDLALLPATDVAPGSKALRQTRVVDPASLQCQRDGHPITLLHNWGIPKPWQAAAGGNLRRDAYLVCLRRLLNGTDLAVHSSTPRAGWLSPGLRGTVGWCGRLAFGALRRTAWRVPHTLVPAVRRDGLRILNAGAQPVRSVRTALDPNLRRAYPWAARKLAAAIGGAAMVLLAGVALSLVLDTWLVVGGVVLVFAAKAARIAWRGRSNLGRDQGWPAGSLRPSPRNDVDHDHLTRCIQRHGPIFKTWLLGSATVGIADLEFARDLYKVHADDLGHAWQVVERFVPDGTIREITGPRHDMLRRLRTKALTATLVHSWEPTLTRHLSAGLDAMAASAPAGHEIDPLPFVRDAVLTAWCDLLLGVSPDDADFREVFALATDLDPDRRLYGRALPDDEIDAKLDRLAALLRAGAARGDGTRGTPSLAARMEAEHPGALADPGIVRDFIFETINTRDDTAGLLMWALKFLADDPAQAQRLRDAGDDEHAFADRVVSETLRLSQSEYLFRRTSRQIEFRGVVIPEGWLVRVCIREVHRDPAHFEHAGAFDPDRFAAGACGREVYAPFGIDQHACVGESLSRTTARVFATLVACDHDFTTVRDGAVGMSVERHWAPSGRWRVAATETARRDTGDERALVPG
jgi:cytochrome P450